MNKRKKPLSFSLCPLNIAYVMEQVAERQKDNSRYSVSQYGDDLITHLRTKAEAKPKVNTEQQTAIANYVKKEKVKRFVAPTVAEVKEYCDSRGNNIDPENFVDHYEANGWFRGKTKVKSWKACVRTWEKGNKGKQFKYNKNDVDLDDRSWADGLVLRDNSSKFK